MRFKLGLLQDSATQEKQAKREAAEAQAAKHKLETPTVKTEAQSLMDEKTEHKQKDVTTTKPKVKIRPLSEAKAIDSGANFVSETFLLLVGVALILGENWRQNRKQKTRREDVAERLEELENYERKARQGLVELEREVLRLRGENVRLEGNNNKRSFNQPRILPREVYELEEKEQSERQSSESQGLWDWLRRNIVGESNEKEAPNAIEANKVTDAAPSASKPSHSAGILSRIIPTESTRPSQASVARQEGATPAPGSREESRR